MPHMVKFHERNEYLKTGSKPLKMVYRDNYEVIIPTSQPDVQLLRIPPQFYDRIADLPTSYMDYTPKDKYTIFQLIEEIIDNTLKFNDDIDLFQQYVNIKEVPQ